MADTSSCGCVWERQKGFGDVIVQQCEKHRLQSEIGALRKEFRVRLADMWRLTDAERLKPSC